MDTIEATLDTLRKFMGGRDRMSPNITIDSYQKLLASGMISHQEIQVYLLIKLLDRLESIDAYLASMSNDSWTDHHNK